MKQLHIIWVCRKIVEIPDGPMYLILQELLRFEKVVCTLQKMFRNYLSSFHFYILRYMKKSMACIAPRKIQLRPNCSISVTYVRLYPSNVAIFTDNLHGYMYCHRQYAFHVQLALQQQQFYAISHDEI